MTEPVTVNRTVMPGMGFPKTSLSVAVTQCCVSTVLMAAGGVSVLYGTSSGLQADVPDDDRWTQGSPGVEGDPGAGDAFGSSLAASG